MAGRGSGRGYQSPQSWACVATGAKKVLTEHTGYGEHSRKQGVAKKEIIIRPTRGTSSDQVEGPTAWSKVQQHQKLTEHKHLLHLWRHRMANKQLGQRPCIGSHPGTVSLKQDSTIHLLKWPQSKTLPTPNAGESGSSRNSLITSRMKRRTQPYWRTQAVYNKPSIPLPHDPETMLFGEI